MTLVEVSGPAIPRFPRTEIGAFVRHVLLELDKRGLLEDPISSASIAFVDDAAMKRLNRMFRKKNRTTDVLTFPADDSYREPGERERPLGDIVISVEQAKRQAVTEQHSLVTEIRHLILHGILHALGYDHETDQGEMNALELELREATGI